jgi:hypothetical protein
LVIGHWSLAKAHEGAVFDDEHLWLNRQRCNRNRKKYLMVELKVRKFGDSLGVVLPKEVIGRLGTGDGERLF